MRCGLGAMTMAGPRVRRPRMPAHPTAGVAMGLRMAPMVGRRRSRPARLDLLAVEVISVLVVGDGIRRPMDVRHWAEEGKALIVGVRRLDLFAIVDAARRSRERVRQSCGGQHREKDR